MPSIPLAVNDAANGVVDPPYRADVRKTFSLRGRDQQLTFTGVVLASATSRREQHNGHPETYAPRGHRCSACRWYEVTIFRREDAPGGYVVFTVGGTIVPGEHRMSRLSDTTSPFEVVELLTIRRAGQNPFIVSQAARALARAAEVDDGIHEAYVNRAVV